MVDTVIASEGISETSPKNLQELLDRIRGFYGQGDLSLIEKAYEFSQKAHEGQIRRSGEPYFMHPVGVAGILADLRLDLDTIATGLLHDTVEDTDVTLDDIEKNFSKSVRELVDGVTKISQMQFKNTHEKQGENIRKMIVAMGKDVRVILVKLADRLHNMRTLNHMPYNKQLRIATETLDIYAPLASRLGISSVKVELEDLSFRYSKPEMFYHLVQKVAKKKKERERYIDEVKNQLASELDKRSKLKYEIQGRPKHLWSIYRKMERRNIDYEQVYDVLAFRIVVDSVPECYEVLGHVHSLWKPIPGRFKDYIAMPKVNNYQSLHTTVMGPNAERIEIQIRTQEMHLVAERGIAAHWIYKEGNQSTANGSLDKFHWLRDLVSHHQNAGSSGEFLENVKSELFESEIYVFTPTGEVKEFPEGATPIDFAYSIHTDVGNHCSGARINGRLVPLKTRMKSGDRIEIMTNDNQSPSKDWLKNCVTSKAKNKIRWHVKNEERKRALVMGEQMLEKDFRKAGYSLAKFEKSSKLSEVLRKLGANDLDDLYVRVGYGKIVAKDILIEYAPEYKESVEKPVVEENDENFLQKVYRSALNKKRKSKSIISVDGMDDVLVRFAKCCNPIPGDPIVGFISRGRGITVHRSDCERVFAMDDQREIEVAWTVDKVPEGVERTARVRVVSHDIPGLLGKMTETFATLNINIHNAQIRTTKDKKAICIFDISVRDTEQLSIAMSHLQKIQGVLGVTRVTQI